MTSRVPGQTFWGALTRLMQKERPRQLNAWTYSVAGLHGNAVRDNHANGEVKEEGGAKRLQDKGAATNAKPLRFAVVGSGPAGFYTADRLLKTFQSAAVDIIERLPTPFGLIRSGVAPDHPETKAVINQFSAVAAGERAGYFGNVTLGKDVSIEELQRLYHGVVLAYGAESCRTLGAPGEDLPNLLSAREFVWWYNGHPDYVNLPVDLESAETAVILGQGNVALDCARILLRNTDELAKTDIAGHALEALRKSKVRRVLVVGRRGPAQAACTAKEVREILGGGLATGLKDVKITIHESDLQTSALDQEEMKASRTHRRVFDLLQKAASRPPPAGATKELEWVFFRSPVSFYASTNEHGKQTVGGVRFEKTRLEGGGNGKSQRAVGLAEFEDVPAGLVLRSIGYKSLPVPGLPFDYQRGVVPHQQGRVLSGEGASASASGAPAAEVPGLYVVGWLKRGPTGIIGTNLIDAEETVASIAEDAKRGLLGGSDDARQGGEGLRLLLRDKGVAHVPFEGWKRINAVEVERGAERGKPREKMVDVYQMVEVARSTS